MTKKALSHSKQVDEHIFALLRSMQASCEVVDLLPASDVAAELSTLLEIQYDILSTFAIGRHYGSDRLEEFLDFADQVAEQVETLKGKP